MSGGLLGDLGVVGSRCLGGLGSPLRVSDPFPIATPSLLCSDSPSQLQAQFHQGAGVVRCGVRLSGKGGHRDRPSFSGVLQSPLCHSQSHRGLATCHRPLSPQRLGGALQFSHGDCPVRSPVSLSGGLDGVPGSPGRLPPGSSSSGFSPLPEVLRGGCGVSVSSPVLRPFLSPSGVHPRRGSYFVHHASPRFSSSPLFGRLASPGLHLPGTSACKGLPPLAMSSPRGHGVIVNLSKSSLVPTQMLDYLGMTLETSPLRVFPTLKRVQKFSLLLQEFLSDRLHPESVWRSLLGMMSSMSAIVPGSRLRMRSLQLHLNVAGPLLLGRDLVFWDDGCLRDLRWWSDDSHLLVSLSVGDSLPDLCLFSDGSDQGWGAALGYLHLSGLWSPLCSRFSINQRELMAILFAVQGFLPHLRGQTVAVYSDNSMALA